jgi:transposase-like protein
MISAYRRTRVDSQLFYCPKSGPGAPGTRLNPQTGRVRTTNMLQRQNQELKRRTRVVRVFPYEQLLLRLVSALLMETNQEWMERIYLNMNEDIFC